MIERLARALTAAGLAPEAGELADLLWLARQMGIHSEHGTPPVPRSAPRVAGTTQPTKVDADQSMAPAPASADAGRPVELTPGLIPGTFVDGALRVRGVAVTGMPANVAHALQGYSRRISSRTAAILDEEKTAEQAAATGIWIPVMQAEREYGFDLLLINEESTTSSLWSDAVGEFARMVSGQVAFRQIHRLRLDGEHGKLVDAHGNAGSLSRWRGSRTAQILVVSDTLSPLWQDGRMQVLLRGWSEVGPITLLQPMPRRAWRHLPMGIPELRLSSHDRVRHNSELSAGRGEWLERPPAGALLLPIIGFDEASLRRWTAVMTGHSGVTVPGIHLIPGNADGGRGEAGSGRRVGGAERVALFRQMASPAAYELAVHLSVLDTMTIPVMRLVQRIMHPNSGAGEMAEVFLGGLLESVGGAPPGADTERLYRFMQDVREVLITSRRRSDEREIDYRLEVMDEQIPYQHLASPMASCYFVTPSVGDRLTDWVLPFSTQSRQILRQRGKVNLMPDAGQAGSFDRDQAISLQQAAVRFAALESEPALEDDEVLGDVPLSVRSEGSVWLVVLVRHALVISYTATGMATVSDQVPVEKLVLVDVFRDERGRGWLNFPGRHRAVEFDLLLWPDDAALLRALHNLSLAGQKAKNGRLQRVVGDRALTVKEYPADTTFFKITSARRDDHPSAQHWDAPSYLDLESGWLASLGHEMMHAYDSLTDAADQLHTIQLRLGQVETGFSAMPFKFSRSVMLIRIGQEHVMELMAAARTLQFAFPHALQVIFDMVHMMFRKSGGISWENPDLGGMLTHSFFSETFNRDGIQYGVSMPLQEVTQDPADSADAEEQEVDPVALAESLAWAVENDTVHGLRDAVTTELSKAVDYADWIVEADSHMYVETDDEHAVLEDWKFSDKPFEVLDYDQGRLTVARRIRAKVRVYASFSFAVKDGIDKDMVHMGGTDGERSFSLDVDAEFEFVGVAENRPMVESIAIEHIATQVDFGIVEPDYDKRELEDYVHAEDAYELEGSDSDDQSSDGHDPDEEPLRHDDDDEYPLLNYHDEDSLRDDHDEDSFRDDDDDDPFHDDDDNA
ncbi:SAV_2336 N-terminal domain-related protein [Rugamonas rubra]|uniref:Uncharacterized protein n=1 Tax=Rugamonas rubra TaxID=758825 RepID=A0A1I4URP4_9BURK|nr:SAV_2336 N-terminal domain-related protein [Rugamonas rubra]SFM91649.1 hypothetical protein SAMN02982985_05777 [Rugamonas rubra]